MIFKVKPLQPIILGKQGEQRAVTIEFYIGHYIKDFGDSGVFAVLNRRPGEADAYPVAVTRDGDSLLWVVQQADNALDGHGKCELQYTIDGVLAKSESWETIVIKSLGAGSAVPSWEQEWQDRLTAISGEVTRKADEVYEAYESGELVGPQGDDYVLTEEDKQEIAEIVDSSRLIKEQPPMQVYRLTTGTANISVIAADSVVSYQWYWRNKNADGTYTNWNTSSSTEATVQINATVPNGRQYRCKVTDTNGNSEYSECANIVVFDAVTDISGKQDRLTAGANITIANNVISATGGGGGSSDRVTPENYGAVGDGTTDDRTAFVAFFAALSSGVVGYIPKKTYLISEPITVSDIPGLRLECEGTIKFAASENYSALKKMLVFNGCDNAHIKGLQIDANKRYCQALTIWGSENVVLEDLRIENVGSGEHGSEDDDNNIAALCIRNSSNGCKVVRPFIKSVYSKNVSVGIYIFKYDDATSTSEVPKNVSILNGHIEDIYPKANGDGVKILAPDDALCNLEVAHTTFIDCRKRAVKFQARGCYSHDNTMIWNELGHAAIDFQRGYCKSHHDTVISNHSVAYDPDDPDDPDSRPSIWSRGYFYSVVSISGNYNEIYDLTYNVTTDPMWSVCDGANTTMCSSLIMMCWLDSLFEKNEDGTLKEVDGKYVLLDDVECSHNVISGIHGTGVARQFIATSFTGGISLASVDVSKIPRFALRNNVVENIDIYLAGITTFKNADSAGFNCKYDFYYNKFRNIKLNKLSDKINTAANVALPSHSDTSGYFKYNELQIELGKASAAKVGFGAQISSALHLNKVELNGSYRYFENLRSERYEPIAYAGLGTTVTGNINTVAWRHTASPENITGAWLQDFLIMAKVGDVCYDTAQYEVSDGQLRKGWMCIADADSSTDYPRGRWKEIYYPQRFDDTDLRGLIAAKVGDVKVNGTSVVSDGAANIPVGSSSQVGAVKVDTSYGVGANDAGRLYVYAASDTKITERANRFQPITPTNFDFAVKAALTDGVGTAYTDAEKSAACNRIGAERKNADGWTLITTMTTASAVSVDLSEFTELVIYADVTATDSVRLTATIGGSSAVLVSGISSNGRRVTYAELKDGALGIIPVTTRYGSTTTMMTSNGLGNMLPNKVIRDITQILFSDPSVITTCNIKIYAR